PGNATKEVNVRLKLLILMIATLLAGCGFQLRGDATLPPEMQATYIDYRGGDGELLRSIARALTLNDVEVVRVREQASGVLQILSASPQRRVLARDTRGRPQEYEIRVVLVFRVLDAEGKVLLAQQEVSRQNNLLLDPTDPLTNRSEVDYAVEAMREDAIWEMLRRISVATTDGT